MSGVVETPFGYHIIKRPRQEAVRDRLTAYLAQAAGTRLDSMYMDSLALTRQIKVARGAPATIRAAGQDPDAARRSNKTLVNYKGGELTVGEFMRWVQALPPQYIAQLKQADDSNLTQFARILAQNVLLLEQADSAKIHITPEEWQALQARYRAHLDTLRTEMGVADSSLGDSSAAGAERKKVAALKVEQYFDRLVEGKTRLRPLPSALATVLRDRFSYRINDAGINRAVELAEAERAKDSTTTAGGLQRAPGPPPLPGVTSDSAGGSRRAPAPERQTSPTSPPQAPRSDTAAPRPAAPAPQQPTADTTAPKPAQ